MLKFRSLTYLMFLILIASCSKEISQLEYGKDQCEHCKMILTDKKYGAELFTQKGKSIKFDATECMLEYLNENKTYASEIEQYLVVNLTKPGELTDADDAAFLISPKLQSPMGEDISSFKNRSDADKYMNEFGGEIYTWDELKKKFQNK